MNQNISTELSKTERIIFRFAFCYLAFYFLFLSSSFYVFFPFLEKFHFNVPFQYISDVFAGIVNRLFIHKKFAENIYKGDADTSWYCIALFSGFIFAFLATIVWTIFDRRKNYVKLFTYLQTYARYYLAFVLLSAGFIKLFGAQFYDPMPDYLMQPLGNINSHILLWTFMGASKSYNFFGGLMEVIPAALLLFRRTAALGAVIAIATLINVLMLNIGYDTLEKALVSHLIVICFFILSPDTKRVFNFFFSKKNTSLTTFSFTVNKRLRRVQYSLKFILIAYAVFSSIKFAVGKKENYSKPYFGGIDGIYEIKDFYLNRQLLPPITSDTLRWKRIGINKFGQMTLQYMNESVSYYDMNADTATKSLTLSSWNDSTFKSHLHYIISSPEECVFEGIYKNDSIRFTSRKIDLQNYQLLKDKGKVKWIWW